jgi:hypothetical protein
MQNHVEEKKVKESEKPRFYGENKLVGNFSHMVAC